MFFVDLSSVKKAPVEADTTEHPSRGELARVLCLLHTVSATTVPYLLPYSSQVLLLMPWTEEELLAPEILMMPGEPVTE